MLSGLPGIKSLVLKYSQHELKVCRETSRKRAKAVHMPSCRKVNGSPTMPPPQMVEMIVSTAPEVVKA